MNLFYFGALLFWVRFEYHGSSVFRFNQRKAVGLFQRHLRGLYKAGAFMLFGRRLRWKWVQLFRPGEASATRAAVNRLETAAVCPGCEGAGLTSTSLWSKSLLD